MGYQEILQLLMENGIEGVIRKAPPPGSHTLAIAARASTRRAKSPEYVLDWVRVGLPDQRGTTRLSREEALQLIGDGIRDEAGLTPAP